MFRFFLAVLVIVCVAGGVAYTNGWLDETLGVDHKPSQTRNNPGDNKSVVDIGESLYPAAPWPKVPQPQLRNETLLPIEPCSVVARDKQVVSSGKDGHLLFIGQEAKAGQPMPIDPSRPLRKVDVFEGKEWITFFYMPWEELQLVDFDMMVAKVEPALAIHEVHSKDAAIVSAQADYDSTVAILKEAQAKELRLKQLRASRGQSVVTDEELGAADATVKKYLGEKVQKDVAIDKARYEKWQADIILFQYDLRSKVPGKSIIKKKYKANGEGIKAQEPILELNGIERLKIEGSVDSQYLALLQHHKNAICHIEPSEEMANVELMKAHRAEVTCVAVCADGEHFVSGSDDATVCLWQRGYRQPLQTLVHAAPVRSVACSPKGAWLLVGCADGSISLWDLSQLPPQLVKVNKDHHRGPVTALAFSPDGDYFASGGEDNNIILWKAAGEVLYPFDAEHGINDPHQGTITALYFTPQCKLVSAARDNTLRVWDLHQKGAKPAYAPIINRGGTVSQLGASADGRFMLFDKGKTLQLVNTSDSSTVCVLDNLAGTSPFDTLAIFSPDGSLMLTGGAGEGRLSLWKTPTPDERAYQVRELVSKDHSAITSAAFAPANRRFAVSGSKDGYVHFWSLPDNETVINHRIMVDAKNQPLHLDLVGQEIEGGKTRVAVNLLNPQSTPDNYRLTPGQRVTIVVELPHVK